MGYEEVFQNGAGALKKACFAIRTAIPSSEKDFLAIGEYLSHFSDRAARIYKTALTASNLLNADRIRDVAAKLRQISEAVSSRTVASRESLEGNIQTLKRIIVQIDEVSINLSHFSRTLKLLRVLGISTRIESSYFHDARFRFESLADEVERSASVIESRYQEMCRQVTMLSAAMGKVLDRAVKTDNTQNTNAASIMEKLHGSLRSLEEKHVSASVAMESLSARSNDVVKNIGEVIMSLQFHDICRQQMEHVGQTIEELTSSLDHQTDQESKASCSSAYRICTLQLAQLSYTRQTILEAVERIIDSMDRIASSVESMSRDIQNMLATNDDRGDSYLSEVTEGAEQVLGLLDANRKIGNQLGEAIRSVTQTSSLISKSVLAIRDIVEDVKLLSLNARIKASMAGNEGRSVSVLSEAIQRLAEDMNTISQALSNSFSLLSKGASELDTEGGADGTKQMLSDLETIRLDSTEANGKALALLSQMREEGWRFADSIRAVTRDEITVHHSLGSSLETASSFMQGVMDDLRPFVGDKAVEEEEEFGRVEDRYTMESERQIHRGESVDMSPALYTQEDAFGDNVELF